MSWPATDTGFFGGCSQSLTQNDGSHRRSSGDEWTWTLVGLGSMQMQEMMQGMQGLRWYSVVVVDVDIGVVDRGDYFVCWLIDLILFTAFHWLMHAVRTHLSCQIKPPPECLDPLSTMMQIRCSNSYHTLPLPFLHSPSHSNPHLFFPIPRTPQHERLPPTSSSPPMRCRSKIFPHLP